MQTQSEQKYYLDEKILDASLGKVDAQMENRKKHVYLEYEQMLTPFSNFQENKLVLMLQIQRFCYFEQDFLIVKEKEILHVFPAILGTN